MAVVLSGRIFQKVDKVISLIEDGKFQTTSDLR